MTGDFGARLLATFATSGHLCVGIDPHPYLLQSWALPDSGKGLREFGLRVVEAVQGRAGIVKPQVAFFERHGSAGYAALEATILAARGAGLIVIADAKRGDLGTSVEAYAQAWLATGSPLEVDAMTVSAYQGVGSLGAPIILARENGKGLFVLAATSNPESLPTQTAVLQTSSERDPGQSPRTVAASIVDEVNASNGSALGPVGVVVGATVTLADYGLRPDDLLATPILAPGFGFQGAGYSEIGAIFGAAARNVVVSSSRAILEAGPHGVAEAVDSQLADLARAYPG